jgi:hypothetical protein
MPKYKDNRPTKYLGDFEEEVWRRCNEKWATPSFQFVDRRQVNGFFQALNEVLQERAAEAYNNMNELGQSKDLWRIPTFGAIELVIKEHWVYGVGRKVCSVLRLRTSNTFRTKLGFKEGGLRKHIRQKRAVVRGNYKLLNRVKELGRDKNKTLIEIAKEVRLHHAVVGNILNGKYDDKEFTCKMKRRTGRPPKKKDPLEGL